MALTSRALPKCGRYHQVRDSLGTSLGLRSVTHRCVDEVEHEGAALVLEEHGGCLSLHRDPPPSLHGEAVQDLPVGATRLNHSLRREGGREGGRGGRLYINLHNKNS